MKKSFLVLASFLSLSALAAVPKGTYQVCLETVEHQIEKEYVSFQKSGSDHKTYVKVDQRLSAVHADGTCSMVRLGQYPLPNAEGQYTLNTELALTLGDTLVTPIKGVLVLNQKSTKFELKRASNTREVKPKGAVIPLYCGEITF